MGISLKKGGNISLKKAASASGSHAPLNKLKVTLNWEERITDGADFDVDASVFLLNSNSKVRSEQDFIFYNQLRHVSGSVIHNGDDLVGAEGESVDVDLDIVPMDVEKISFVVTIYR